MEVVHWDFFALLQGSFHLLFLLSPLALELGVFLLMIESVLWVLTRSFYFIINSLLQVTLEDLVSRRFGQADALIEALLQWFPLAELLRMALEEVLLHTYEHVFRICTML